MSNKKLAADLVIQPGFPSELLTEELCLSLVRQAGIPIDDSILNSVRGYCENPQENDSDSQITFRIANGQQPQHGQNGRVVWKTQELSPADVEQNPEEQEYSHYDRKSYSTVKTGDILGQVIPPTPGEDGRDVLGGVIKAKSGRPTTLKFDESIVKDASGNLIAQFDGVLFKSDTLGRVLQKLELPEYVDFSTGNIDFPGDVYVYRGVRDRFVVKAEKNVEVRGLIEAASIISGADMIAHAGMAGRERGSINVGGTLKAKYLENVGGHVYGDVLVGHEIVNCELAIRGAVDVTNGRIVGGEISSAGPIICGDLGSSAYVPTVVVLGSIPDLENYVCQLADIVEQLTIKRQKLQSELDQINNNTRVLTAEHRERQTEIMFEMDRLDDKSKRGTASQMAIEKRISEKKIIQLTVRRQLYQGVVLRVDQQDYRIGRDIKGPITIKVRGKDGLVYVLGDSDPMPLSEITKA